MPLRSLRHTSPRRDATTNAVTDFPNEDRLVDAQMPAVDAPVPPVGACPVDAPVPPVGAAQKITADSVARQVFEAVVGADSYPCVGARSVLRQQRAEVHGYPVLGTATSAQMLLTDLARFAAATDLSEGFASFIAVFMDDPGCDEAEFEELLWRQLQAIRDRDDAEPDPAVSNDPTDPHFAFSIAGTAYFVVGLHPRSSRAARRSPLPLLAFNLHEQFDMLREDGRFGRMRDTIRKRDAAVNGSVNPMVADHGELSEAAQYSGRRVGADWVAPFCP